MKKIAIIVIFMLAGVFAQAQTSVWDGSRQLWTRGTGTQDDPFLIESAANLAYLSYMVGKGFDTQGLYFKLTVDVDLNGSESQQWIPIGLMGDAYYEDGCERRCLPVTTDFSQVMFKGHFDGDNHSISNIYINRSLGAVGLFGALMCVGPQTVVENVFVTNGYIKGSTCGGIVGTCSLSAGTDILVSRCWNGADIEGSTSAGGIVGGTADKIRNCYSIGSVFGSSSVGGIVGTRAKEVTECCNYGEIMGDSFGGGILGGSSYTNGNTVISNCYNTGNITISGTMFPSNMPATPVGGIAGFLWRGESLISNCYNVGQVLCENYNPGGVIGGLGNDGTVENAYYLVNCGGEGLGVAKTAEEMRDPGFVDVLNYETDVWCADTLNYNDGYPILGANNLEVEDVVLKPLTVYPNPAHGHFTVEGTGLLVVINVLGQQVLARGIEGPTTVELPQGVYFVRLQNDNEVRTGKVVVN